MAELASTTIYGDLNVSGEITISTPADPMHAATKSYVDSNFSLSTHNHDAAYVNSNAAITAGTNTKITYDAKGLVTGGSSLVAADIPSLDTAKITTGIFPVARGGTGLASYTAGYFIKAATSTTLQQLSPAQVRTDIGAATSGHGHDHGGLVGLADDDHPQYILVTGTRAFTGPISIGNNRVTSVADPTLTQDATNKRYVDDLVGSFSLMLMGA